MPRPVARIFVDQVRGITTAIPKCLLQLYLELFRVRAAFARIDSQGGDVLRPLFFNFMEIIR
jgi:hypothetical protein